MESPYSAKIRITLPTADEIRAFVADLVPDGAEFEKASEVTRDVLADKLVGLSRVSVRTLVQARAHERRADHRRLPHADEEGADREGGRRAASSSSSPTRTLDDVAGHDEAKAWLREDAVLLKRGRTMAIPMGYLLTGRIGTGKTYLVECLAGEIGIPCVEMKNFRDKWVGATEGNLEKVFSILHALGQVIVFVDEADQMTGKRGGGDGDSGLSGRVYGDAGEGDVGHAATAARSSGSSPPRGPTCVEVDLKRQGRLDVHIPLFPPGDAAGPRDALRRDGAQAQAAAQARGAAAAARQRPDRRQRDGGHPGARAARSTRPRRDAEERGPGQGGAAAASASRRRSPTSGPRPTSSGSS